MDMNRRTFFFGSGGLLLSVWVSSSAFRMAYANKMDRIGMGTVLFRYRFKQTRPKEITALNNELTLLAVPEYYRSRFDIANLEFWSNHFESLEPGYLAALKDRIRLAGGKLCNVQIDEGYDLASINETQRQSGLSLVKKWLDAVSFLGSACVRVNPGRPGGSVEKSIQSMREINRYARDKKLVLLTEDHFGIEMNPDIHVRIVKEAGPGNIYTLPDFGNYPVGSMYTSLEKIMPYAYLISAKAMNFNQKYEHLSYDFDECVRLAERYKFKGIYSVEQWSPQYQDLDYEKVADWLIDHVKANI